MYWAVSPPNARTEAPKGQCKFSALLMAAPRLPELVLGTHGVVCPEGMTKATMET